MNLYTGSVEKWNLFFKGLGYQENDNSIDFKILIESLKRQKHSVIDIVDYFQSDFVNTIETYEMERMGVFTNKSEICLYSTDHYDYASMIECLSENLNNQDDGNKLINKINYIGKYIRFFYYSDVKKSSNFYDISIMKNLVHVWSSSYLPLMPTSLIISAIEDATHSIYFIPYGNVTEVWLYESSVDFYRFRCFAEMIVVNTLAGYLGYEYLEEVTIDDLRKYNADLILNLDLLQQSDLPMG